jgi:hypothetical protein
MIFNANIYYYLIRNINSLSNDSKQKNRWMRSSSDVDLFF